MKARSASFAPPQQTNDSTMLNHSCETEKQQPRKESTSCIVESLLQSRKTTSKGRSHSCGTGIQTTQLSRTLPVESTSKEKDFSPYWNQYVQEMSQKLWLPTKIGSQDLGSTLSNGWSSSTVEGSWFSRKFLIPHNKNWSVTCYPSSQYFPAKCMVSENTILKSKKIRIYPNAEQKKKLQTWMGAARFAYNQAVEHLRLPDTKANWMAIKTDIVDAIPDWLKETPYQIKSVAVRDACKAVSSAKLKFKRTKKFSTVKFRAKRAKRDSLFVSHEAVKKLGFYTRYLGESVRPAEDLPEAKHDCRVLHDHGRFYLIIPVDCTASKPENQRFGAVALDPGVRTFQAFYSPALSGKIGESSFGRVYRLCGAMDILISKMSKAKCRKKRNMRIALERIRFKIRNLVDEIHHKTACFLCNMFDVIIIPPFETSNMVTKLHSKTARAMLTWAHYRFKCFLKQKAAEKCCTIIENSEAYTSKTCSCCGEIQNIGSKKLLKCKNCGTVMDRDLNGARGIFLRALRDHSLLHNCSMQTLSLESKR